MIYTLVTQGISASELQQLAPIMESSKIPEGGMVELQLNFGARFPGFEQIANQLNGELVFNRGVQPWIGQYQVVFPDPNEPIYHIRWMKGIAWATYIVAALIAIALIVVTLANWKMFKVIPEIIEANPWIIPVGIGCFAFFMFTKAMGKSP